VLLGVLFTLRTSEGTLVVEVDPPATIQVLDAEGKLLIEQKAGAEKVEISVVPGKGKLRVVKNGVELLTKEFSLLSGGREIINARLEPPPIPGIRYVRSSAKPNGDGRTWATAWSDLSAAISDAEAIAGHCPIWVAAGTYRPGSAGAPREATFHLRGRVELFGGFAGDETQLSQRKPEQNRTILNGDLKGDDQLGFLANEENAFHVVTIDQSDARPTLDGLTITGGNANGGGDKAMGGGLFCANGDPFVRNCRFEGNSAAGHGGGAYNYRSGAIYSHCEFRHNRAGRGGGMHNHGDVNNHGQPNKPPVRLVHCTFERNTAAAGGALFSWWADPTEVFNCRFLRNEASGTNEFFGGGGLYNDATAMLLVNCVFVENRSAGFGAAISAKFVPHARLVNCTLAENATQLPNGHVIHAWNAAIVNLGNSIVWNYSGPSTGASLLQGVEAKNSCVRGGAQGEGNADADPRFIDLAGGDLRLQPGSPCINSGDDQLAPSDTVDLNQNGDCRERIPLDLDGQPRFRGTVDMGAYEAQHDAEKGTGTVVPPKLPEKQFDQITPSQIAEILEKTNGNAEKINGSDNGMNQLLPGSIVVYRTKEGRYGKLEVLEYGYNLVVRLVTYKADGSVIAEKDRMVFSGTWLYDLDQGTECDLPLEPKSDIFWEQVDRVRRYLAPRNGALIALFKADKAAGTVVPPDGFLVNTRDGLRFLTAEGKVRQLAETERLWGHLSRFQNKIAVYNGHQIREIDCRGKVLNVIAVPNGARGHGFAVLPNSRFVILDNAQDKMYFLDSEGSLLKTVKMRDKPDNHLQNIYGIVVGNDLVMSEDGDGQLLKVDLTTYECSVLRKLRIPGRNLGAVAYDHGTFYVCGAQEIHAFAQGQEPRLVARLDKWNITGIVVKGKSAYVSVNFTGQIQKVDLSTGAVTVFAEGLNYPEKIIDVGAEKALGTAVVPPDQVPTADAVNCKLRPRQGMSGLSVNYYRPMRITLSAEPTNKPLAEPRYRSKKPLYGTIVVGTGPNNRITVVLDEPDDGPPRLFVDRNNDKDLSNDGPGESTRQSAEAATFSNVVIDVPYETGPVPSTYSFYRFKTRLRDSLFYYRDSCREGEVVLDGNRYKLAVLNENGDGRFDDLRNGTLIIDLNQDGKLEGNTDSAESYRLDEPFNVYGQVWEVASLSPNGMDLSFRRSTARVPSKPYFDPGSTAPTFSGKGLEGETVDLKVAAAESQYVLLDFWASWCPPCRDEFPCMRRLHARYKDHGLRIIGITIDNDRQQAIRAVAQNELSYSHLFDGQGWKNAVAQLYRVHGVPKTYLLDKDLKIVAVDLRGNALEQRMRELLGEGEKDVGAGRRQPPPVPLAPPKPKPKEAANPLIQILPIPEIAAYAGEDHVVPIRIERSGYDGPVNLRLEGLQRSLTAAASTIPAGQSRVLVDLAIAKNAERTEKEVRTVASFNGVTLEAPLRLAVAKRPVVRPFTVPLNGLCGRQQMLPVSFGPDWLGNNKPASPAAWLAPGTFAGLATKAALRYPRIPVAHYVMEMELEMMTPETGLRICLGDHFTGVHLSIYWKKERQKFECCLMEWRYGGWGWCGGRDFELHERLPLKWIVLDGRQVLCLKNKPILSVEFPWPADLTLTIWSENPGSALIHRCSFRPAREEEMQVLDWPMPQDDLSLDKEAGKARFDELKHGLPRRPIKGKNFAVLKTDTPMVWIAPGQYDMGSTDPKGPGKRPVRVSQGFWMRKLELTQGEWNAIMPTNPSHFHGSPYLPVDSVTWQDAMLFCAALNKLEFKRHHLPTNYLYRLPTEAEWEYACRAGSNDEFSVKREDIASRETSNRLPRQVGEKAANAWGLFDMHGNVMEWCIDAWHDYPKDDAGVVVDPFHPGKADSDAFVVRGGAFWMTPDACNSSWRDRSQSEPANGYRGFRLALGPALNASAQ